MTERHAIDLLMEHKAEPLAATAWEGFCAAGRGFMVSDGANVGYFPACMVTHFPPVIRRRVQQLVRSYQPERELVVLLAVPVEGQIIMALGKRTPALRPEEAFLKWTGRPECPPMQTICVPTAA